MKLLVFSLLSFILIFVLFFLFKTYKTHDIKPVITETNSPNNIDAKIIISSRTTSIEDKISALKSLKEISLDESNDSLVRIDAGEAVVSSFFDHGTTLSSGFSEEKDFDERDIYEYAKIINSLGDSQRNSLLTAYIALRFYSNEVDKDFVSRLLNSHLNYLSKYGITSPCSDTSKFASVVYLSQKNAHTDVSDEFGDYFDLFDKAFSNCKELNKVNMGFMWLAAISDIGTSSIEQEKAQELVEYITRDTSDNSALVRNLKRSYFTQIPEPDTETIVKRLVEMYPEFDLFIETIRP